MPKEKLIDKQTRAKNIIRLLKKHYPDACCSLNYKSVHQLMVATILSAQCTDERVNAVTPALFKKYSSVNAFAKADPEELKKLIFSTGFHNNKGKSIIASAKQLVEKFNGKIPKTLRELTLLAGLGRKSGSVVLGEGFGLAEGIVVDTHVGRISRLLGFTKEKDPIKIEKDLMKIIPEKDWIIYSHLLIFHGRSLCKARKPDCLNCFLIKRCPFGSDR
jgi:endonuclease III